MVLYILLTLLVLLFITLAIELLGAKCGRIMGEVTIISTCLGNK
jgi:hypothetical protein